MTPPQDRIVWRDEYAAGWPARDLSMGTWATIVSVAFELHQDVTGVQVLAATPELGSVTVRITTSGGMVHDAAFALALQEGFDGLRDWFPIGLRIVVEPISDQAVALLLDIRSARLHE